VHLSGSPLRSSQWFNRNQFSEKGIKLLDKNDNFIQSLPYTTFGARKLGEKYETRTVIRRPGLDVLVTQTANTPCVFNGFRNNKICFKRPRGHR
jgi:hypothetical protein